MESAPIFFDVSKFNGKPFSGLVDVVFGGIPCQPHSTAGKQLRGEDDRDLVDEFLRIVSEVGPKFAVVENVRGFLSGDGIGRLLGGLSNLGFDAEWEVVSAAQVGAPHRRERVFVLAYSKSRQHSRKCEAKATGIKREHREQGATVGDSDRSPSQRRGELGELRGSQASPKSEGDQRQRCRASADSSGEGLGNPERARLERRASQARGEEQIRDTWPPGPSGDWSNVPEWLHPALFRTKAAEPGIRRMDTGVPALVDLAQRYRVDRLRALGNGCIPIQAETALRAMLARAKL